MSPAASARKRAEGPPGCPDTGEAPADLPTPAGHEQWASLLAAAHAAYGLDPHIALDVVVAAQQHLRSAELYARNPSMARPWPPEAIAAAAVATRAKAAKRRAELWAAARAYVAARGGTDGLDYNELAAGLGVKRARLYTELGPKMTVLPEL